MSIYQLNSATPLPATQPSCPLVTTATSRGVPTTSLLSPPQLSQPITSSTPLPLPSPARRNVGAIVGGIVGGIFAGIIALVFSVNAIALLYRWLRTPGSAEVTDSHPPPRVPPPTAVVEKPRAMPIEHLENPQATLARPPENLQTTPSGPPENTQITPPGLSETTQISVPGDETHIFQHFLSNGAPYDNRPDANVVILPSSVIQDVIGSDPGTNGLTVHLARTRPNSQMDPRTRPPAGSNPILYLIPSDPFASTDRPLSIDFSQYQQQQAHRRQSSIRRSRHRLSRSDGNIIPIMRQPTIPEQDVEFIGQEVVAFMLADPMEQPASRRNSYSSTPVDVDQQSTSGSPTLGSAQRSLTLGSDRHSIALDYVEHSPILGSVRRSFGFSRAPASRLRHLSRGSSMEGG